jgi:lysophospholipase L1-like esterase
MSQRRQNAVVVAATVALSLAILEIVARAVLPQPLPWLYPQLRYRSDSTLIFSLARNQRAYTVDKAAEINARGLRGALIPYARNSGDSTRILFLGDSIVFGYGVTEAEAFPSRVAWHLSQHNRSIEVINSGVPGYNTDQEVIFAEQEGVKYDPDRMVLGFCWNDIVDKHEVHVSKNGALISAGANEEEHGLDLMWESPVGYEIRNAVKRSRVLYGATRGLNAVRSLISPDRGTMLLMDVLEGHTTEKTSEGWRSVGRSLHRLKELARAHGFQPLVVAFPISLAFQKEFPASTYPTKLRALAEEESLAFIDLSAAYSAAYNGHESLFIPFDTDHPNANGHDIAAKATVDFLVSQKRRK